MLSSNFKEFPEIQEVECWPASLEADQKLLSLELYTLPYKSVVSLLNVYTNNCLTHGEYSSCVIHNDAPHTSKVRMLVSDLGEGEERQYGCDVKAFTSRGETTKSSSVIVVRRPSE
jgi:hypothetical protein